MPHKDTKQLYDLEGNEIPSPQIIDADGSEIVPPALASADDPDSEGYNEYADDDGAPSIFRP